MRSNPYDITLSGLIASKMGPSVGETMKICIWRSRIENCQVAHHIQDYSRASYRT